MAKLEIPSTEVILENAIKELLRVEEVQDLQGLIKKQGLSAAMVMVEEKASEIYKVEEKKAVREVLAGQGIPPEIIEKVITAFFSEELVTRIANTRRARAGGTTERILRKVFNAIGIPCEKAKERIGGYMPDIAVPSNASLKSSPERSVAIATKRTLRERWSEDTNLFRKFKHGKFVLLTPDPNFNEGKAKDMIDRGMKEIYIPDSLYEKSKDFVAKYNEIKKHSQLVDNLTGIMKEEKAF